MNSYLGLVSQYAKVHKKKNRLTLVCIALSVMLITAIFGMADMSLQSQRSEAIRRYGNWHAIFSGITDHIAQEISARGDVNVSGWLGMADDIAYHGKALIVQGSNAALAEQMNMVVTEGDYPAMAGEALLDRLALDEYGISIGDEIEVLFPDGKARQYTITGTFGDYSTLKGSDAHGLQLSTEGMRALPADLYREYYYVQFGNGVNLNRAIREIQEKYRLSAEQVSTNVMLLGLMGQSDDSAMLEIYLTAGILFILVAMAGCFMIASSFNMSILERIQFFGLLRCLGATKRQIKHYIRREGLLYCTKAVPMGLLMGTAAQWITMFVLNRLNSKYLPSMPSYQISWVGVGAGMVIGFLVVMVASGSPAKRAARVSPQAAVTGNLDQPNHQAVHKASNTALFHVDTAMGVRHGFSNKKSMVLIAGSLATSIILFLCFSVLLTFMNHALSPLKSYTPDLSIEGVGEGVLLDSGLPEEIEAISGVENVYGRMYLSGIPASIDQSENTAALISYDRTQFTWAKDALIDGDIQGVENGCGVLVYYGYLQENDWQVGDTIFLAIDGKVHEVPIAGIISDIPVDAANGEWIIIASENTFTGLTAITDYKVIDIQADCDISGEVRSLLTSEMKLLDLQQQNNEVRTGYYAMAVFAYGFLVIIALVALSNIINTVGASVTIRMNHYGVMRAVGMSGRQLEKMIAAEAAAYAVSGCIAGSVTGLLLHRFFYGLLITSNWGAPWQPPAAVLTVTVFAVIFTSLVSARCLARKIENMSVINVVNSG